MAEYGLLWKPGTIKGNITLAGYEGCVGALSFGYGSSASKGSDSKTGVSVSMSGASLVIHAGAWAAELLESIYRTKDLGETTIFQLAQAVDPAKKAAPTVIQKIVLSNTLVTGFSQNWTGGGDIRTADLQIEFSHFVQTYDTKTSDFIIRNVVASAV